MNAKAQEVVKELQKKGWDQFVFAPKSETCYLNNAENQLVAVHKRTARYDLIYWEPRISRKFDKKYSY